MFVERVLFREISLYYSDEFLADVGAYLDVKGRVIPDNLSISSLLNPSRCQSQFWLLWKTSMKIFCDLSLKQSTRHSLISDCRGRGSDNNKLVGNFCQTSKFGGGGGGGK